MIKIRLKTLRILGYSLLTLLFLSIAGISIYQAKSLETRVRYLAQDVSARLKFAYEIERIILALRTSVEKFIYLNKEEDNQKAEKTIAELESLLDAVPRMNKKPRILLTFNRIKSLTQSYIRNYRNLVIRYRSHNDNKKSLYRLGDEITTVLIKKLHNDPRHHQKIDLFLTTRLAVQKYLTDAKSKHIEIALANLDRLLDQMNRLNDPTLRQTIYNIEDYKDNFEGLVSVSGKMTEEVNTSLLPLAPKIVALANEIYADGWNEMQHARQAVESDVNSTQWVVLIIIGFAAGLNVIIAFSSITYRRLLKEKALAEASAKAKSSFIANVSHEIRTPLNAIIGMCDLTAKTQLDPKQKEYFQVIRASSKTLLGLINDILDFSKIEAEKMIMERIHFSIRQLMDDIAGMFQLEILNKGIEFIINIDADVPDLIIGDPLRLQQVVINLVSNAIKFTHSGEISILVENRSQSEERADLVFHIRDTGIGIHPDATAKIFDVFTQADGSTTRRYGGTGLGLAICKKIITLMGGDIQVYSRPGEGSTFSFNIPFSISESDTDALVTIRDQYTGCLNMNTLRLQRPCRLLLVEDNQINQVIATEILKSVGFSIETALDGSQALQRIRDTHFDAVLMDIQMPEMDGLEATRRIREEPRFEALPIIAMTAAGSEEDRELYFSAGMSDYVTKPIDQGLLFLCLAKWLPLEFAPAEPSTDITHPVDPSPQTQNPFLEGLPGLDIPAALNRVSGNKPLYIKLLRQVIDQYNDSPIKIRNAIENKDLHTAKHLIHTIRGISGNIGAIDVQKAARQVEIQLQNQPDADGIDLEAYSQAFQQLKQTADVLEPFFKQTDDRPKDIKASIDIRHIVTHCEKLLNSLHSNSFQSIDLFEILKTELSIISNETIQSELNVLERQLDQFDFTHAIQTVAQLIGTIQSLSAEACK